MSLGMNGQAWSVVLTGLSLTCITATALFALVAVNPKEATYGSAPWIYAFFTASLAVVFNRAAAWANRWSRPREPAAP